MPKTNTFCVKPWNHACIRTNGDITLCCLSREPVKFNIKTSTIKEWWNGDFVAGIRQQFLNNERPIECMNCFDQEDVGVESLRQRVNREYQIIDQYPSKMISYYNLPTEQPIEVEFQLTNLCNLKCLMCWEQSSSQILSENKILKITVADQSTYTITSNEIDKIKEWIKTKPKLITLIGGEPMIVPEIKELLQWAIENEFSHDIDLHITTNGTKFNDEWHSILRQFKKSRVMVSIDSVGAVNDYIRSGSKWSDIEHNVKQIATIPGINLLIHATVQNLNLLSIGSFFTWCEKNNYFFDFSLLQNPDILLYNNLPRELLELAIDNLNQVNNKHSQQLVELIKQAPVSNKWQDFKNEINMRDNIRRTNILSVIPELGPYWNAKTE